jgi:long-subunit acyl-CoA synthetase (AMP-forming)
VQIKVWGTNAEAESLVEVLREALVRHKHRDFIGYWIFDTLYPMGAWKYVSYVQFALLVEELRAVLRAREFQAGDRLAIISRNSVEWAAFAFATWGPLRTPPAQVPAGYRLPCLRLSAACNFQDCAG